jgi:putative aldouronate transport system substrate-binding protein
MSTFKHLSRRQFLQLSGIVGTSVVLAACAPAAPPAPPASTETGSGATTASTQAAQSIPELLGADMPGSPNHARGWTTTLPDLPAGLPPEPARAPIEISATRRVDAQTRFAGGDSLDNNPWSRMIEKLFGVKFTVAWTWATADEANSKYNLAMASGDLPDYLETVPATIFVKMVEADMLEEISDAYTTYANQLWQDTWAEYGERPWTWVKINDGIYGIPRVEQLAHNDTIMWYRADWFEELGLEVPTTLDELHAAAKAIVDADIGMGAPGTTIGLLANRDYAHTWYGSLDSIWASHGVVPSHWSKDGNKLSFDGIQPEMKEPLALLNQWYNDGLLRRDFFTLNTSDSIQDLAASQCGIHFTPSWGANLDAIRNNPSARWGFASAPAGPRGVARHTENNFRESPFCFRKGMQHVDKVFEITNWMMELTEEFDRRFHGWEGHNYEWQGDEVANTGIGWMPWAPGPIGTRGSGMIDPRRNVNEFRYQDAEWGPIPEDERDAMQNLILSDPTGVNILQRESRIFILDTADQGKLTELQRLPTPTMVERGADLQKLLDENILGIIIGEKPLSDFDNMVAQWKSMGGDRVTDEVNEWWASKA